MKLYKLTFIFILMIVFLTGCGSSYTEPVSSEIKENTEFSSAWEDITSENYTDAYQSFEKIISTSSDVKAINEAKVAIAFIDLSKEQKDIDDAISRLEQVFSYSYDTVYEPYYNTNVDNADARAILAMAYLLKGDMEKFNTNLNIAKTYGGIDYDTKNMLDSLSELLN